MAAFDDETEEFPEVTAEDLRALRLGRARGPVRCTTRHTRSRRPPPERSTTVALPTPWSRWKPPLN
jgi:hypothetical protein